MFESFAPTEQTRISTMYNIYIYISAYMYFHWCILDVQEDHLNVPYRLTRATMT